MPKFNPANVDTSDLDTAEADALAIEPMGEHDGHGAAPEGFVPDEDALADGVDPDAPERSA